MPFLNLILFCWLIIIIYHFIILQVVKNKIKYSIGHYFGVNPEKIYLTHPTFFSEITSKEAVTVHDEYWHPHVDKVRD